MGNRAVITASKALSVKDSSDLGVYVHWNGGRDSVEAFLEYCKLQGFRSPETDPYGYARLVQVIANYFGAGGLSVGIGKCCNLDCDNWDNGVYIIENWEIVDRKYFEGHEQDTYDRTEMLLDIDECQPEKMQLGKAFITAPIALVGTLKVGDRVYVSDFRGGYEVQEVVGIGENKLVNGTNVFGIPFVDIYQNGGDYSNNINNYLRQDEYRVSSFAQENESEMSLPLMGGKYLLYIQSCDSGYDYTVYCSDNSLYDGGQLDEPDMTIREAAASIIKSLDICEQRKENAL